LVLAVLAAALIPAAASAVVVGDRETGHLTPPAGTSNPANGDSDNISFSQDNRVVRYAAFDTSASNLVAGDTNGKRDVLLFQRQNGAGNLGGNMQLASVNNAGQQSNGDSVKPRLDGSSRAASRCLVFESQGTNLDPRDKTPDIDVFLRNIKAKKTTLISTGGSGDDADIAGDCGTVVYSDGSKVKLYDVKDKTQFVVGRGTNPDMQNNGKGAAYERGGQIYYQAFQKVNRMVGGKRRFIWIKIGKEQLVSRTKSGAKGNGASANPTMDDNGYYVSFESDATNLCANTCSGISEDKNGARDIFRRTLPKRPGGGASAPTKDFMEMVSFSCGAKAKGDPCEVNQQANGPSRNAFMTGAGENIVFESQATNLKESTGIKVADPNGPISDIYYWNFPRARMRGNVSRESRTNAARGKDGFDAPATKPAASNRANYIAWSSIGGANLDATVPTVPTVPGVPTIPGIGTVPATIVCSISSALPVGLVPPPGVPECPPGTPPAGLPYIGQIPNPAAAAPTTPTTTVPTGPTTPQTGTENLFIRFLGASHEGHDSN
jgi:hypothetical protein